MAEGDPVKESLMDIGFNLPDEVTQFNGQPLTSFERSELQRLMSMDVNFRKNLENIVGQKWWNSAVKEYEDLAEKIMAKGCLLYTSDAADE